MKITYFGHSCFGVETSHVKLLFDPFITPNQLAANISVDDIEADYIFISHGHEDHVADAVHIAKRTGATVVAAFEITQWLGKQGVDKVHPMNTGGKWTFDFGMVQMVPAFHSSSLPDGSYGGSPIGYVIQLGGYSFYFAGDTALYSDMRLIGEQYNLDFAFLPIGSNFTMDIHDALRATKLLDTDKVFGMHYDTFPYIKIDKEAAVKLAEEKRVDLHLLPVGGFHLMQQ
ncbi:metal-dependent hydrolase [Telluribacter humicola]|uniref:metal-dependent hydrolase n=1 Tax=Telluribacter humicola TaxID=1720261 RepID=UPI001A9661AD|nr:metal-dependent hydrolase [Telluribacter humicola]